MTAVGRRSTSRAPAESPEKVLYEVRVADIWRFVWRQPASFWLLNGYLFFEYVRPQSIYPALAAVAWTQLFIIGCGLAALKEGRLVRRFGPADVLLLVFTVIIVLSCFAAYSSQFAFQRLPIWLTWVLIYLLITGTINTEARFLVLILAFYLYNLKMSSHGTRSWAEIGFGFRNWGVTGAPGWFENSGEFGIEMTIYLSLGTYFLVALRPFWPTWKQLLFAVGPVTALLGGIGSSSRGALVGFGAVVGWMLFQSKYRIRALVIALVIAVGVVTLIPEESKQRFAEAGEDSSSVRRLTYWEHGREITRQHPVLGIGFENWLLYYRANYNPRGQVSHNPFIQAASELGVPGLLTYCALILVTMVYNRRTRRLARRLGPDGRFLFFMGLAMDGALMGYLAAGFFVTVLYYPFFWINLAMTVALHNITRTKARAALPQARPRADALPQRA